ncbi:transposase [Methanoregula sp.]|uniref:transposase n=1 Tax=Methanoregula sp. TaxID=2052170 RepID=UPI00356666C9
MTLFPLQDAGTFFGITFAKGGSEEAVYFFKILPKDPILSEDSTGIQSSAVNMFSGFFWQMCHIHFIRAVIGNVPRKHQMEIAETFKECLSDSRRLLEYAARGLLMLPIRFAGFIMG